MIQCKNCEHYKNGELTCDPASTIKEEACLLKWMFIKLTNIEQSVAVNDDMVSRVDKLMQHAEHRVDEEQRSESWRSGASEDDDG